MGFFPPPLALLAPGLAINLELWAPGLVEVLPDLPFFLLFTGNDIQLNLIKGTIFFADYKLAGCTKVN
jgi:hypothetical protein